MKKWSYDLSEDFDKWFNENVNACVETSIDESFFDFLIAKDESDIEIQLQDETDGVVKNKSLFDIITESHLFEFVINNEYDKLSYIERMESLKRTLANISSRIDDNLTQIK